jgi:hypothetical protein
MTDETTSGFVAEVQGEEGLDGLRDGLSFFFSGTSGSAGD